MLAFYLALIDDKEDCQNFEEIYYTYRKQMFLMANSILHNSYDAEDAVHDAFIAIARNMKNIERITNHDDLRNYVLKASKNYALNMLKRNMKYQKCDDVDVKYDLGDNTFLDTLCEKMAYQEVLATVNQMDSRYKEVLYYHYILEFSVPEVAELLDRKVATVKQQLIRGKKLLLDLLNEGRTTHENEQG